MRTIIRSNKLLLVWLGLMLLVLVCGCTRNVYRRSADEDTYRIINDKSALVPGMPEAFSIENGRYNAPSSGDSFDTGENSVVLSLEKALEIAVENNRDYQSKKEALYNKALDLTLQRHQFGYLVTNEFGGEWSTQGDIESRSGNANLGLSKIFATGGRIALNIGSNFQKMLTGEKEFTASSLLSLSILQPLFKGAGKLTAWESLTQAERNVIYELRGFARYRRQFSVRIASSYYSLLQKKQTITNEERNYIRVMRTVEETEEYVKELRRAPFEANEAELKGLEAENRLINTRKDYEDALDQFKIELGLTTESMIEVSDAELDILDTQGIVDLVFREKDVIRLALENRLDLKTSAEKVEDAKRKVEVAANALKIKLDISANASAGTEEPDKWTEFMFDDGTYSAGASLELPLDKLSERNSFRKSLISFDQTRRTNDLAIDNVKLSLRKSWRKLDQARQSFVIQEKSLELSKERLAKVEMSDASTRDELEAQDTLLSAENGRTRALINHTIARLELLRDMDMLKINENGLWEKAVYSVNNPVNNNDRGE